METAINLSSGEIVGKLSPKPLRSEHQKPCAVVDSNRKAGSTRNLHNKNQNFATEVKKINQQTQLNDSTNYTNRQKESRVAQRKIVKDENNTKRSIRQSKIHQPFIDTVDVYNHFGAALNSKNTKRSRRRPRQVYQRDYT